MRYTRMIPILPLVCALTMSNLCADTRVDAAKDATPAVAREQAKSHDAPSATAPDESAIKELGTKEGEPVDTGFVFFEGQYINSPYTVSRRGRRLFVNDVIIYQWDRWPLPDLRVDEDPGYPPGLTERSTFNDILDKHNPTNGAFSRKMRYLYQHFPAEVARQKTAEWLRGLPFVESAESQHGTGFLKIRMKNGKDLLVSPKPPDASSPYSWQFTNRDIVERLEFCRGRYEAALKHGEALFLFSKGGPVPMAREKAGRDLGLMTEILRSDRTKEEKIDLLQRMEILYPPSMGGNEVFMPLIAQFRASKQLEERIDELVKEMGVEPRTLRGIPDEHPLERQMRLREDADKKPKDP